MAMVEDILRLDDSSATSFLSCESNGDRLIEYLPSHCRNLSALCTEDFDPQAVQDSSAPIRILSETNGFNKGFEQLEIVGEPNLETPTDNCSFGGEGGVSTLQDQLEQDRAESLDFDDLIEVTHEDFPEESGDSDSDNNMESQSRLNDTKEETTKGRRNVSFGLVRTHKICQGVDPPSNHALTESTDCDLTENELCSIEVYELNYRSPTKSSSRARSRNRADNALQIPSLTESETVSENAETPQSEEIIFVQPLSQEKLTSTSSSYHVIQAVDDGCPREILLAENFDFPRFKRRTKI